MNYILDLGLMVSVLGGPFHQMARDQKNSIDECAWSEDRTCLVARPGLVLLKCAMCSEFTADP